MNLSDTLRHMYFEKSESVLWAATPTGLILHNFITCQYLELSGGEVSLWCFLDGSSTLPEIEGRIREEAIARHEALPNLRGVFQQLVDGGFLRGVEQ
jgi:hypothetical protein